MPNQQTMFMTRILNIRAIRETNQSSIKIQRRKNSAFTLIEIAIALLVVAFAFVPLFGLLPVGLGLSREAIDATVQSQIVQQLTAESLQTDYSSLTALATNSISNPYYFDEQGNRVSATANPSYEAAYYVSTNTAIPDNQSTQKLAKVTICILNKYVRRTNHTQTDLLKNADSKKFVLLVPDNGR